jgi:uncharacterized protein DUF4389
MTPQRPPYPVAFELDFIVPRSRLSTFFRYILAIPHLVFLFLYSIVWLVVLVIAWFALLFTARWPSPLYGFAVGFMRYQARVSAYLYLAVDPYPPFSGADDPSYPVRVQVAPPLERYSRLKVFFRVIYSYLAQVIAAALAYVILFASFLSWWMIVFTGRQSETLQDALRWSLGYVVRANALIYLLTETYPLLSEPAAPASAPPVPVSGPAA